MAGGARAAAPGELIATRQEGKIASYESELSTLRRELQQLAGRVSGNEEAVLGLGDDLKVHGSMLQEVSQKQDQLGGQVRTMTSTITLHSKETGTTATAVKELRAKMQGMAASLTMLKTQASIAKQEAAKTQSSITNMSRLMLKIDGKLASPAAQVRPRLAEVQQAEDTEVDENDLFGEEGESSAGQGAAHATDVVVVDEEVANTSSLESSSPVSPVATPVTARPKAAKSKATKSRAASTTPKAAPAAAKTAPGKRAAEGSPAERTRQKSARRTSA